MKNNQPTSSKEVLEAGLIVRISKQAKVSISLPCSRLQRKVEDFLLRAKIGSGQVNFIVERYFPKVLSKHPWVKISRHSDSAADYLLLVRCDEEVFECKMQMQRHLEAPGLLTRMSVLAEEICKDGWFGKKEINVVPAHIQKPRPQVPVCAPQKPAEPMLATHQQAASAPVSFVEQAGNWLTQANALIAAHTTKIAELEAALEQEIATLRAKYAAAQKQLQDEIEGIKEIRRQLSSTSPAQVGSTPEEAEI